MNTEVFQLKYPPPRTPDSSRMPKYSHPSGSGNVTGGGVTNEMVCDVTFGDVKLLRTQAQRPDQMLIAHNSTVNIKTKMHTKDLCSPCMSRLDDKSTTIVYNT